MVIMATTYATVLGIPYLNQFQPSNHQTSPHSHLRSPIPNPNSLFPPQLSLPFASTHRANSATFGTSTLSSFVIVPQQRRQMGLRSNWKRLSLVKSSAGRGSDQPDAEKESGINIQLPRRSLLVQFTCDACGERTKRLINRLAYERGTVFVQCAGCLQHHKLVDNLGLVVEYDFRNEAEED